MWKFLLTKVFKARDKFAVDLGGDKDIEKPFIEHLEDLRTMIVRMAVTIIVITIATFVYCNELLRVIKYPIQLAGLTGKISLFNIAPTGAFMTAMNISMVAGIVIAFPLLLYFLMQFVLPGLRTTEKKIMWPALGIGGGLFITGMLFSYFVVLPGTLEFFYQFGVDFIGNSDATTKAATGLQTALASLKSNSDQSARVAELVIKTLADNGLLAGGANAAPGGSVAAMTTGATIWELVAYVKFVCQFILLFGACFELPVVVMAFVKLDVLNYNMMKGTRAWAAVIIAIVAAVITPTQDMLTLSLLAVPMYVLYEICIWLAYYMQKKDKEAYPEYYKQLEEDEKATKADDEADWDKPDSDYNPWSTAEEDDDEAIRPKSKPTPTEAPPAAPTEHKDTPPADPHREKTLEETSREDEQRTNTD
jgi:sec-independent protein translocase protein TatC